MMNILSKNAVLIALLPLLTACGGDNSDLTAYIKEVKSRPGPAIEVIPKFAPLPGFKFPDNDSRRSPFKPLEQKQTDKFAPNQNRPKEPLEVFPLDTLKFVGILEKGSEKWGLIRNPDKKVTRINVGNYMGLDYGRVISITNNEIKLEEIIKNSGKWEKHITTINLDTGK